MHHKIFQIIQTGQHGQNGLPVAAVVEVDYQSEPGDAFLQSVLTEKAIVLAVDMKRGSAMRSVAQV